MESVLETDCTAMDMYLALLNYILQNDKDNKFMSLCILQLKKKEPISLK